jgi:MFS family permease
MTQAAPTETGDPKPKAPVSVFIILCSIWCGLVITEAISANILPLTIKTFTDNPAVIGLILALNPFFGFIAQPLVGILGDRIWTPLGRRAFFLIVGAPVVALCLVLIPEVRVLWFLVVLVVIYQFTQDILWGSDHPLLADLVPARQRILANSLILTSSQLIGFFFLKRGMGWLLRVAGDDLGGEMLYFIAAFAQVILVAGAALFLKEKKPVPSDRPRLTPVRYFKDFFGDRILRKFGFLAFFQAFFFSVITTFIVLFAVEAVGITSSQFGNSWSWFPLVSLFFAIPMGIVVEKYLPKQWALVAGYAMALVGCGIGYFASDADDFVSLAMIFGTGMLICNLTQKPFFTEFIPKDIIGQVAGTYNICFAVGRTIAAAGGGYLIKWLGSDYRMIFPIAFGAGVIAVIIATTLRDPRFEAQRLAKKAGAVTG